MEVMIEDNRFVTEITQMEVPKDILKIAIQNGFRPKYNGNVYELYVWLLDKFGVYVKVIDHTGGDNFGYHWIQFHIKPDGDMTRHISGGVSDGNSQAEAFKNGLINAFFYIENGEFTKTELVEE